MSEGHPTATSMIRDGHKIFHGFKEILKEREEKGPLFLMGRSLGSASAIELAFHYQAEVTGLIVESGFSDAFGLLSRFGISIKGVDQEKGLFNLRRIQSISIPTLTIHSQYDHIIPVDEGIQLHDASGAKEKELVIIPNANHNDLMMVGMDQYFDALEKFIDSLSAQLGSLDNFILPGGSLGASHLHVARTVCRRAERLAVALAAREPVGSHVVKYLNRLSDALFVTARYQNMKEGVNDVLWDSRA